MEHTLQINQVNLSSFKNYNIKEKRFKEKLVYIVTYASCTMPKALYKTNWNSYAKIKGHTQVLTTNGTQSETSCLIICLSKNLVKLCKYLKLSPDRTKFQIKKSMTQMNGHHLIVEIMLLAIYQDCRLANKFGLYLCIEKD